VRAIEASELSSNWHFVHSDQAHIASISLVTVAHGSRRPRHPDTTPVQYNIHAVTGPQEARHTEATSTFDRQRRASALDRAFSPGISPGRLTLFGKDRLVLLNDAQATKAGGLVISRGKVLKRGQSWPGIALAGPFHRAQISVVQEWSP